jgi:hypothetical protein
MHKNRKQAACSVAAAYLGAFAVNAAQSVTSGLTASQLVDLIVPSGGDITIIGTPTYTGASVASGSFSGFNADSGLPFSSGLLLTSGHVNNALGPNNAGDSSQNNGLLGSSLLEAVTGQAFSLDASTLTFQFRSTTPNFSFRYVFASEEYNEWVNGGVNDAFAFVLDDGSTQVNLATVGSSQVSIDTVNLGVNSSYYSNNSPGPYNIEYDGLAGGIDALSLIAGASIVPEQTYTIHLIIADRGDRALDSGVFLQGGSFTGEELPPPPNNDVPEPGTYAAAAFVAVVAMGSYRRRAVRRQAL